MRARRFPAANKVWELAGGNEDNALWAEVGTIEDEVMGEVPATRSVWELDAEERAAVAAGANVSLTIVGAQPPVMLRVTDEKLGRG